MHNWQYTVSYNVTITRPLPGLQDGRTILSGIVILLILVFLATKLGELVYHSLFPSSPHDRDFITHPEANLGQLKDAYLPGAINSDSECSRSYSKYLNLWILLSILHFIRLLYRLQNFEGTIARSPSIFFRFTVLTLNLPCSPQAEKEG